MDALNYVGLARENAGVGRAFSFLLALSAARLTALAAMGLFAGSPSYVLPVIAHVMPTAFLGDATMVGVFALLERRAHHLPLAARIVITAFATTAVSFALQGLREALPPEALMIALAVGVLFPVIFLTGLALLRFTPLLSLGVSAFAAVVLGSLIGDALTFVKLSGSAEQLPRLLASAIMVLEHGAIFAAALCVFMAAAARAAGKSPLRG